jgi:hypothetical protein
LVPVLLNGTHTLATHEAPSCLRLFRELRPVPDGYHPHGHLVDAVKEAIGRHNDLSIWQFRELGNHAA